jgi:hypothetical protein
VARPAKVRLRVFDFICVYKEENDGIPPTYEQISAHFSWSSPSNAWDHVMGLERDGMVTIDPHDRKYRVVDGEYNAPVQKPKNPYG